MSESWRNLKNEAELQGAGCFQLQLSPLRLTINPCFLTKLYGLFLFYDRGTYTTAGVWIVQPVSPHFTSCFADIIWCVTPCIFKSPNLLSHLPVHTIEAGVSASVRTLACCWPQAGTKSDQPSQNKQDETFFGSTVLLYHVCGLLFETTVKYTKLSW